MKYPVRAIDAATRYEPVGDRNSYTICGRLIVALMLRFKPAKNVLSDTLIPIHLGSLGGVWPDPFNWPEDARSFCYLYRQHVNGE
jgi:hypothetical protein